MSGIEQPITHIVAEGGGGGLPPVLDGVNRQLELWQLNNPGLEMPYTLTGAVAVGDSGGSTNRIRKAVPGMPAPGDIRASLTELSGNEDFGRRFDDDATVADLQRAAAWFHEGLELTARREGNTVPPELGKRIDGLTSLYGELPLPDPKNPERSRLHGHSLGNLLLAETWRQNGGSLTAATKEAAGYLAIKPWITILPVTEEAHNVMMYDQAQDVLYIGEGVIDEEDPSDPYALDMWLEVGSMENRKVTDPREIRAYLERRQSRRSPHVTPEVALAIQEADKLVAAPGSLAATKVPIYGVDGVPQALAKQGERGGSFVLVTPLSQEKQGVKLPVYIDLLGRSARRNPTHVIYNTDSAGMPEGVVPFQYDPATMGPEDSVAIGAKLVDTKRIPRVDKNDAVAIKGLRALAVHDRWVLADLVLNEVDTNPHAGSSTTKTAPADTSAEIDHNQVTVPV